MFNGDLFADRYHMVEARFIQSELARNGITVWLYPAISAQSLNATTVNPPSPDREDHIATIGIISVVDKDELRKLIEDKQILEQARKRREEYYAARPAHFPAFR